MRPVRYRRFDGQGEAIDLVPLPIVANGFHFLGNVWAERLNKGTYSAIVVWLENGQRCVVRKRRPKVDKAAYAV